MKAKSGFVYMNMTSGVQFSLEQMRREVRAGRMTPAESTLEQSKIVHSIRAHMDRLLLVPPGPERARLVMKQADTAVRDMKLHEAAHGNKFNRMVKCRKGCAACCYQNVDIAREEATLLAELVTSGKASVDRDLLTQQAKLPKTGMERHRQPAELRRCPFLKNNECSVYEDRPAACRKYFVTSDPKGCELTEIQAVDVAFVPEAEFLVSAYINVDHYDSLPKLLKEELDKKEKP